MTNIDFGIERLSDPARLSANRQRQRLATGRLREFEAIDFKQNELLERAQEDPLLFVNKIIGHAVLQDLAVDPHCVTLHAVTQASMLAAQYKDLLSEAEGMK